MAKLSLTHYAGKGIYAYLTPLVMVKPGVVERGNFINGTPVEGQEQRFYSGKLATVEIDMTGLNGFFEYKEASGHKSTIGYLLIQDGEIAEELDSLEDVVDRLAPLPELPELEGSDRQMEWALKIRAKAVREGLDPRLAAQYTSAKAWIDNRENLSVLWSDDSGSATEEELRSRLDNEIAAYLRSVGVADQEVISKALKIIRESVYNAARVSDHEEYMDAKTRRYISELGLTSTDEFYGAISLNFSPRHYQAIVGFIKRHEAICDAEVEKAFSLEQAVEEAINREVDPLGDEYFDELGGPAFAAVVYSDRIEVRAFEPGMGEVLPRKDRKYIGSMGDIRWEYPLSSLSDIKRLGCPVVEVAKLKEG